jgi:hypothetical protein
MCASDDLYYIFTKPRFKFALYHRSLFATVRMVHLNYSILDALDLRASTDLNWRPNARHTIARDPRFIQVERTPEK